MYESSWKIDSTTREGMVDIVERLRESADRHEGKSGGRSIPGHERETAMMREAAEQIESLKQELEETKRVKDVWKDNAQGWQRIADQHGIL